MGNRVRAARIIAGGFSAENVSIVLNDVLWQLTARGGYIATLTLRLLHKFAYGNSGSPARGPNQAAV